MSLKTCKKRDSFYTLGDWCVSVPEFPWNAWEKNIPKTV
jgi:hypothetical protein